MITDTVLQATPREDRGKNASRRLRADGRIPVTVYGQGADPVAASINARELGAILRSEAGRHAIFTLAIDGGDESPVKIHQLDLDPVTSRVQHLDLMRISMREKTQVSVPLDFVGESVGVKSNGGMLEVHLHQIEIECLPRDVPVNIPVDVTELDLGDHLNVSDLKIENEDIEVITGADHLVVAVTTPRGEAETPAEEPVEPAAEPAE
jgi:large subunit ribosomal protein L25